MSCFQRFVSMCGLTNDENNIDIDLSGYTGYNKLNTHDLGVIAKELQNRKFGSCIFENEVSLKATATVATFRNRWLGPFHALILSSVLHKCT